MNCQDRPSKCLTSQTWKLQNQLPGDYPNLLCSLKVRNKMIPLTFHLGTLPERGWETSSHYPLESCERNEALWCWAALWQSSVAPRQWHITNPARQAVLQVRTCYLSLAGFLSLQRVQFLPGKCISSRCTCTDASITEHNCAYIFANRIVQSMHMKVQLNIKRDCWNSFVQAVLANWMDMSVLNQWHILAKPHLI